MISRYKREGFTLIELLVVVAMIAIIAAAMTVSVAGAQERARVQKATVEVKAMTQAVLAYENFSREGLPVLGSERAGAEVNASNLGFLLGKETSQSGKIPVLLLASLSGGGKMLDPWGHPYKVTIRKNSFRPNFKTMTGSMQTGFCLPNFYRLREEER